LGEEGKVVANFLLSYVRDTNKALSEAGSKQLSATMRAEWTQMLTFVRDNFPDGFKKKGPGRKVPRVRFEAIAVGVGLALRSGQPLETAPIKEWLVSEEFKDWTTSDASNNRSNLVGRLEFVRNKLLGT